MSSELTWELIRNNNSFLVKRNGFTFSREAGNLVNKHSYKYSGLAQSKVIKIGLTEGGVSVSRRSTKASANAVAKSFTKAQIIKSSASPAHRAQSISRDMQASGYRLDLVRAASARVCALLASMKPRKTSKAVKKN